MAICCALFALFSCTNQQSRATLADVSSCIQEHPDSALLMLENMNTQNLNTRALKAEYSLLYATALDKNYIDTTDLNIIQPAIDYYTRRHGTTEEKMKSYYYQGIIFFNGGEYDNAIVSFSRAEELVPEIHDMQSVGLLFSRISDTYNKVHNAEEEYNYIVLAEDAFNKTDTKKYYHSTLWRKGEALSNLRKYSLAEQVYQQLLNDPSTPTSISRMVKEDYALLLLSRDNREPRMALDYFEEVLSDGAGLRNINLWSAYAFALSSCGSPSSAESVFSQLYSITGQNKSVVDIWKSAACEKRGDYREAFSLLQNSLTYQDSLLNISLAQTTARAQRDYLALKNSQIQLQDKNHQMRLYLVITILTLMSLVLYFVLRSRNEKLNKERIELVDIAEAMKKRLKESEDSRVLEKVSLEDMMLNKDDEIHSLQKEIASREKILGQLRGEYVHMYKSQFKYLGDLCETFLLANEKKDSQRIVYEKVQDMIKNISSDKVGQRRFERMIDKSLDNLMKHFRDEFPKYSEEDYRFISYIFVGFDATTLSIIFNMPSIAAVYMKKSRIKKSIQESEATYKAQYLAMIE